MFVYILFVLALTIWTSTETTTADIDKVEKGLKVGETLTSLIKEKKFTETLTYVARNIGSFLGAIGPFVSFVMAFIPVENAVLNELKRMMSRIDGRFDKVDTRLDGIERKLNWAVVQISMGDLEQRIKTAEVKYHDIFHGSQSSIFQHAKNYIDQYPSIFQGASTSLYLAIIDRKVLNKDFASAILSYKEYDRRQTQEFLLGVMHLLLKAVKVELQYYGLKNQTSVQNDVVGLWTPRIVQVKKRFQEADDTCVRNYHTQLSSDIFRYSANHLSQSNEKFVAGLFNELSTKYYWRYWVVVAYNEVAGWDKHTVSACGGYVRFRTHGRNFLVASVPRDAKKIDRERARRTMRNVKIGSWLKGSWGVSEFLKRKAKDVYDDLDTTNVCSTGVIKCNEDIRMFHHSGRLVVVNRCPHFYLFMFG